MVDSDQQRFSVGGQPLNHTAGWCGDQTAWVMVSFQAWSKVTKQTGKQVSAHLTSMELSPLWTLKRKPASANTVVSGSKGRKHVISFSWFLHSSSSNSEPPYLISILLGDAKAVAVNLRERSHITGQLPAFW
ncbi:hypothetical protein Pelo_17510 [Pelomyxa schiedti]|nr:hypothetical protein Pelo_17510 [Pelomyxa schiedti]